MGQKVSPHGFRVGVIQDWDSKWYAKKKNFSEYLAEDYKVRELVKKELYAAGVSKVVIERTSKDAMRVTVLTRSPGMVIGQGGKGIEQLKAKIEKLIKKERKPEKNKEEKETEVTVSIIEVKRADADAQLAAESVAQALEKRVAFRRAMKQTIQRTMKAGAKGIKVVISGRVGGAEIARSEKYAEGNVPLHTLRANIDYGFAEADTQYGRIGVKVWVNNGEVLDKILVPAIPEQKENDNKPARDGKRNDRKGGRQRRDGEKRSDKFEGKGRRKFEEEKPKKAVNPRKRPNKPVVVEEAVEAPQEAPAAEE